MSIFVIRSSIERLDEPTYFNMAPKPPLTQSKVRIFPYQADTPLTIKGEFTTEVAANNKSTIAKFLVVPGSGGSILGRSNLRRTGHP